MAVLENIRKRGGIIAIVIGLALFAFVLGDFIFPSGGRVRNLDVAKVGRQTLNVQQLEEKINEMSNRFSQGGALDDRMRDMVHDQAWNELINETILLQTFERVKGLAVSPDELWDIITGFNPPPILRQLFANQQTGEFDRAFMMDFLRNKDMYPEDAHQWAFWEKRIVDDRYMQKYNELVSKGIYVPDFMAENENQETNRRVDFDYIVQNYFSIPDSLVDVSNNDLRTYYNRNRNRWQQDASRDIEFVVFNIVPSDEDRVAAQEWIENIKPAFEEAEDPFQFIAINAKPVDTRFLTAEQLPMQTAELFNAPIGSMVGPYLDDEIWKLVRLTKAENRPDSVRARQIVLATQEQTQISHNTTVTLADSIKTAIENGANFAVLAAQYSADPGAATNSGDIGWLHEISLQGSMMESLFDLRAGEVTTLNYPGQGVIVIQVTERGREVRKVQLATLQHEILPSTRTEQIIFTQASKFAIENRSERQFDEAAAEQNLFRRSANFLGENDRQIPGLQSARQIIRWAHEAKRGDISDVFTFNDMHVVAILKNIRKEGFTPMEDLISEIDLSVRRTKKGELISAQLLEAANAAQSFSDLAINLNLPIETANGITFSTFSIPNAGIEPELIATAAIAGEGNISNPVEGFNGVYLFTVTQVTEPDQIGFEQARFRLMNTYASRAMQEALQALHEAANIKDMRSKFY